MLVELPNNNPNELVRNNILLLYNTTSGFTPNNEWKTLTPGNTLKSGFSYMMTASESRTILSCTKSKIEITIAATATTAAQQEQAINTFISIYEGMIIGYMVNHANTFWGLNVVNAPVDAKN